MSLGQPFLLDANFIGNIWFSAKLDKNEDELLMDLGDGMREKNEVLRQIDRNLAFIDYGKGYRVGSEFWSQPEWIGTEDTGIQLVHCPF